MITETRNKKIKTSAVGLTTENQSVVASTITGFMNAHRSQNGLFSSSGNPQTNGSNVGVNRQVESTANQPVQIGGYFANNRYDMSQISYTNFGNIVN